MDTEMRRAAKIKSFRSQVISKNPYGVNSDDDIESSQWYQTEPLPAGEEPGSRNLEFLKVRTDSHKSGTNTPDRMRRHFGDSASAISEPSPPRMRDFCLRMEKHILEKRGQADNVSEISLQEYRGCSIFERDNLRDEQ